jgi:hypothetical protein
MSTDPGPPKEASPPLLCIACNNPGTKRCGGCGNARYCSEECQKRDWKQHKAICQSFATLPPRPSPQHYRAILFPVDEDKPRFKWIRDFMGDGTHEDRLPGLGSYETIFCERHH